jgi:hypothetical protein
MATKWSIRRLLRLAAVHPNPRWPLRVILQAAQEQLTPRPLEDPNRASGDSLSEVLLCAIPVPLREPEEANVIMCVELFPARRAGLRQERIRGKSAAIMLAYRFIINVRS